MKNLHVATPFFKTCNNFFPKKIAHGDVTLKKTCFLLLLYTAFY